MNFARVCVLNSCRPLLKFAGGILLILAINHPARAGLPLGWSDADIGAPGLAGSASATNGNWIVTGGGSDIWNAADQFNFASTSFGSDGSITAQVTSLQNSDPGSGWSKGGVMFRNDTNAGAVNVSMVVSATVAILILVGFESVTAMGGEAKNAR